MLLVNMGRQVLISQELLGDSRAPVAAHHAPQAVLGMLTVGLAPFYTGEDKEIQLAS